MISGASGSGKSLLLRALAFLDPYEQGELLWRGTPVRNLDSPDFRSRVIYSPQQPALLEGTVEDNLRLPFELNQHSARLYSRDRVVHWLESLHRDANFLNKESRDLSGGETQLTTLLRVLQLDPEVLLLDEPTSGLDSSATAAVEHLLLRWVAEQSATRALMWVTHDNSSARRVGSAFRTIHQGRFEERQS